MSDWRVSISQHAVDAVIAIALIVVMVVRPELSSVAIALLGPLVGARAAAGSKKASDASPGVATAVGGVAALVLAGAQLVGRAKGVAAFAVLGLALAASQASCAATDRSLILRVAGRQCVAIEDPAGRAICIGVAELLELVNARTAAAAPAPSSSEGPVATIRVEATATASASASAAPTIAP